MSILGIGIALQLLPIAAIAFLRKERHALAAVHIMLSAGLVLSLFASLPVLFQFGAPDTVPDLLGIPGDVFRFDPLAMFFLCLIEVVAIPTSIYSYSYFSHVEKTGRSVRSILVMYTVLLVSTQLLVIANHAILFLVFWEIMSMAAYFGIVFEREKAEVRTGGMYYFAISHLIVFLLYAFFFLMHAGTQSWLMSACTLTAAAGGVFYGMYALALVAFGMKAGFMPFHFWLPRAHPIAPTVISTFLSGVIIKTGIYGMLRTFQMLQPTPEWLGWIVLVAGMISAIFGVWYALAQHDIKTLLAYHSVENIGIIGIGIGLGFIGSAYKSDALMLLGFGGALLHTLNHAIFKSLLFIGSGVIARNLGTRIIERMGGIVHRAKYFVALFLIGSIAISGLPPLNGFISEFILYNAFFSAAKDLQHYYPLAMLLMAVGLAFVGGLAVACFSKLNAVMFLGSERETVKKFSVSAYEYAALGIPGLLCVVIGLHPLPFIEIVNDVVSRGILAGVSSSALLDIRWPLISWSFRIVVLVIFLVLVAKWAIQRKYGMRISDIWACGYDDLNPRMQYTASSFSDALNSIAKTILLYRTRVDSPGRQVSGSVRVETHSSDLMDEALVRPLFAGLRSVVERITIFRYTDVRMYVASLLVILLLYSFLAFVWK